MQIGLRTTYGLKYLEAFPFFAGPQNILPSVGRTVAWLPRGPFLLIADLQVKLYHVQQDVGTFLGILPGYQADGRGFALLHTYYDIDANVGGDYNTEMVIHIVGVTDGAEARAYLWMLKLSGMRIAGRESHAGPIMTIWTDQARR